METQLSSRHAPYILGLREPLALTGETTGAPALVVPLRGKV